MAGNQLTNKARIGLILGSVSTLLASFPLLYISQIRLKAAYSYTQLNMLSTCVDYVVKTLAYEVSNNSTCVLDCLTLRIDPWECYNPRDLSDSALQCANPNTRLSTEYTPFSNGDIAQIVGGVMAPLLYVGLIKLAVKYDYYEDRGWTRNLCNVLALTLSALVTFMYSYFAMIISLPEHAVRTQATCSTLKSLVNFTYQNFVPSNNQQHLFFPGCNNSAVPAGSYPAHLNASDFANFTINPISTPEDISAGGYFVLNSMTWNAAGIATSIFLMTTLHVLYNLCQDCSIRLPKMRQTAFVSGPNADDDDDEGYRSTPLTASGRR